MTTSPEQLDLRLHSASDLDRRVWHFNVALVGSSRAGKTKLLQRFVDSQYSDIYSRTSEVAFVSKAISIGQHHVVFQCWDTPGSSRNSSCLDSRIDQLHAVFIVFDGSRDAVADLEHWHHLAMKSPTGRSSGTASPLLVMVANKTDLGCHQASMTRARDLSNAANGLVFSLSVLADEENLEVDAMMLEVGKALTERFFNSKKLPTSSPPSIVDREPSVPPKPAEQQPISSMPEVGKFSLQTNGLAMGDVLDPQQGQEVKKPASEMVSADRNSDGKDCKTDCWSRLCCCVCW